MAGIKFDLMNQNFKKDDYEIKEYIIVRLSLRRPGTLFMYRKFPDEDRNPNSLDPENFWKSESDILKGLTAAYAGLQAYHRMGATFRTLHCDRQLPQRRAGLPPDVTAWMELAMYNNESTNYVPNDEWTNLYTSINYCNQCLDNIPNVPDNDDEGIKQTKATSIAEARFLRAFYYYRLFINFGERTTNVRARTRRYRRGILSSSGRSGQTEDFHRDRTE